MVWIIKIVIKTEFSVIMNMISCYLIIREGSERPDDPVNSAVWVSLNRLPEQTGFRWGANQSSCWPRWSLERVRLDLVGFGLSSVNGLFLKVICLSGCSIKPFTLRPSWVQCDVYSWSVYTEKVRRTVTQSWGESKRAQGLNHRTFLSVPSSPKELSHKQ